MSHQISPTERTQLRALSNSLDNMQPKEGDLRVWHIPQIPGSAFYIAAATPGEAQTLLKVLAAYDAFQFLNRIKPDYSNASGLEVFTEGEWCEWYNEDGDSIHELQPEV